MKLVKIKRCSDYPEQCSHRQSCGLIPKDCQLPDAEHPKTNGEPQPDLCIAEVCHGYDMGECEFCDYNIDGYCSLYSANISGAQAATDTKGIGDK